MMVGLRLMLALRTKSALPLLVAITGNIIVMTVLLNTLVQTHSRMQRC